MSNEANLIQELADRQEIADLVARLGLMLDEHQFEEAPSILAPDVTVQTPGGSSRGLEGVIAQARRNHTVRTQHVVTNLLIDVDGERARVRANLIVTFAPDPDRPGSLLLIGGTTTPTLTLGERYGLEAAQGEGGWRLTAIEVTRVWSSQPVPPGARIEQIEANATTAAA